MNIDEENIKEVLIRITGALGNLALIEPWDPREVDTERFNRIEFYIVGRKYACSVFIPGPYSPESVSKKTPELPLKFTNDYRLSNPRLHRLYVKWALQELEFINQFVEEMGNLHRHPASIFVTRVLEIAQENILNDAAWFEAAGLIQAKVDLAPYLEYDEEQHEQEELQRVMS